LKNLFLRERLARDSGVRKLISSLAHPVSQCFINLGAHPDGVSPMAYNTIELQRGMSIPEFLHSFGTEAQCAAAVTQAR